MTTCPLCRLLSLATLLILLVPSLCHAATGTVATTPPRTIYVSLSGNDANDGLSTSSAKLTIQAGVNAANPGDTVLVADGTYTGNGNRDIDFLGKNLTLKSQNGAASTIIDCQGSASSPHRGIYIHSGETAVTIDGFTIKNGYAPTGATDGSSSNGGGAYIVSNGSVSATDCAFTANTTNYSGGGAYIDSISGTTVTNCTFTDNSAPYSGGAYLASNGSASAIDCTFTGNSATSGFGGAEIVSISGTAVTDSAFTSNTAPYSGGAYISSYSGTAAVTNCTFTGNSATSGFGGGAEIVSNSGTAAVTDCTFTGNTAPSGFGGGAKIISNSAVTNCIFWGDGGNEISYYTGYVSPSLTYSDIQGGVPAFVTDGGHNINTDPKFIRNPNLTATPPDYGDLHLQPRSLCLGAGADQAHAPAGVTIPTTDLDGNTRPDPPSMGAYDSAVPVPATLNGFTLSPNLITAPGPTVTVAADVSVSGTFSKVTVSPAPGTLGFASPTFTLTNSGTDWTGTIPTSFLKLAKTNPVIFIATGTRSDGSTAQISAPLTVGAVPTLFLSVHNDKSTVPAGMTFSVKGVVQDTASVAANPVTVTIPLPSHLTFVSSPNFKYNSATNTATWTGTLAALGSSPALSVEFQAGANTPANTPITINVTASAPGFQSNGQSASLIVGAPPSPVGIDIDTTGAAGQADGTAVITSLVGASPLTATISPVSGLGHAWLGVDHAYAPNGGPLAPTTDLSIGSALAKLGLVGPGLSPTYAASFPRIGSQCNIGLRMTYPAALVDIASIAITAITSTIGPGEDSPENVIKFYDQLDKIQTFQDAASLLTAPATSPFERVVQEAAVVKRSCSHERHRYKKPGGYHRRDDRPAS